MDPRLATAKQKLDELLELSAALKKDGIQLGLKFGEFNSIELNPNTVELVVSISF